MENKILDLLEKNSRASLEEISTTLEISLEEVSDAIQSLIDKKVICGFNTVINWDKTEREFVTALIEVRVEPQGGTGFDRIAEKIGKFEEVKSVYLISGGHDLTLVVEGANLKKISNFVSEKLSTIDAVSGTNTQLVLKKYKDNGVSLWGSDNKDERMLVSP